MIRPGTSVNRPAMTSAPEKIRIMIRRWSATRWRCACHTPSGDRDQREDREQMDGAPWTPELDLLNPERADCHAKHQQHPDPADGAVRQRSLGRRELSEPQHEGRHRRQSVDGDRRCGIEQWCETQIARLLSPSADPTRRLDQTAALPSGTVSASDGISMRYFNDMLRTGYRRPCRCCGCLPPPPGAARSRAR